MIGASGYTGADLVRLAACHPAMEIAALTANSHAGKAMAEVFPHLAACSAAAARQERGCQLGRGRGGVLRPAACDKPGGDRDPSRPLKVIDMSADFRLRDPASTRTGMAARTRRWSSSARPSTA